MTRRKPGGSAGTASDGARRESAVGLLCLGEGGSWQWMTLTIR
jgi:hypothetical protein